MGFVIVICSGALGSSSIRRRTSPSTASRRAGRHSTALAARRSRRSAPTGGSSGTSCGTRTGFGGSAGTTSAVVSRWTLVAAFRFEVERVFGRGSRFAYEARHAIIAFPVTKVLPGLAVRRVLRSEAGPVRAFRTELPLLLGACYWLRGTKLTIVPFRTERCHYGPLVDDFHPFAKIAGRTWLGSYRAGRAVLS